MAMSKTTATHVNTLLRWLLGPSAQQDRAHTAEQGRRAAEYLAGEAYRVLAAGIRPDDVTAQWAGPGAARGAHRIGDRVTRRADGESGVVDERSDSDGEIWIGVQMDRGEHRRGAGEWYALAEGGGY